TTTTGIAPTKPRRHQTNVKSTIGSDSPITVLSSTLAPRTLFLEDARSDSTQDEELDDKEILTSVFGFAIYEIDDDVDIDSLCLYSPKSIEVLRSQEVLVGQ
ncbi:hypothetical protein H2248_007024, partial [Termitomyces sp. 'cryptogamus']